MNLLITVVFILSNNSSFYPLPHPRTKKFAPSPKSLPPQNHSHPKIDPNPKSLPHKNHPHPKITPTSISITFQLPSASMKITSTLFPHKGCVLERLILA